MLKQDTIETVQFDGSFQAHLDTIHLLPTRSNLQLHITATPADNLTISEKQAVNSTSFISLHKRGATVKSDGGKAKPFLYLYTIFQCVISMILKGKHQYASL